MWRIDLYREGFNMEQIELTNICGGGPVMDVLVSSMLDGDLLLLRYHNSINMSLDGVVLARI